MRRLTHLYYLGITQYNASHIFGYSYYITPVAYITFKFTIYCCSLMLRGVIPSYTHFDTLYMNFFLPQFVWTPMAS